MKRGRKEREIYLLRFFFSLLSHFCCCWTLCCFFFFSAVFLTLFLSSLCCSYVIRFCVLGDVLPPLHLSCSQVYLSLMFFFPMFTSFLTFASLMVLCLMFFVMFFFFFSPFRFPYVEMNIPFFFNIPSSTNFAFTSLSSMSLLTYFSFLLFLPLLF